MKILIASDVYRYQTNGVASAVKSLADGLRRHGYDVRVLAPAKGRTSGRDGNDYLIGSHRSLLYPDVRLCVGRNDPLIDELKRWKPDLIHLHTEASMARIARGIAGASGAPLVMSTHTDYAQFVFGRAGNMFFVRLIARIYGKIHYRRARAVIVPSEKSRGFAMVRAAGDRVHVIPNGIRLERFQRPVSDGEKEKLLKQYSLRDNGRILVTVSRLSREKNIMEILRCFPGLLRAMPEAQLLIVGGGPDQARLEKYVARKDLGDRIRFTGRVDPDEVYRYYALGNLFVSASTFETEGLTYLEALACGLPLLCREDPVLINVLRNGENGFTYRTGEEFTDGAVRILENRRLWEEMHEKALEGSEHFDAGSSVERTISLYEQVLRG